MEPIETVAYQARTAARHRPCGAHPCMNEFPGMPSRWCSGCLIAALLALPANLDGPAGGAPDAGDERSSESATSESTGANHGPTLQEAHRAVVADARYPQMRRAMSAVIEQRDELLAALKAVLEQFETGAFVRNTDSDGCSDWAIKAAAPLQALLKAQFVVAKVEGE